MPTDTAAIHERAARVYLGERRGPSSSGPTNIVPMIFFYRDRATLTPPPKERSSRPLRLPRLIVRRFAERRVIVL
jgi:hypothetical protein